MKGFSFQRGPDIKSSIFSAIRDINETLSLSNEPGQLVNMSLDTLSQVMEIECCWIQTIEGTRRTRLAAARGFNTEMQAEVAAMDMAHVFAREIIGLGHRVLIPDLSADGVCGLESFRKAGFKWLVAVPLMTYRIHGILGLASRSKKLLKKETPELAMVIGGLIGTALNKYRLFQKSARPEKPPNNRAAKPAPELQLEGRTFRCEERPFDAHTRRMKNFRGSHEPVHREHK